MRTTHHITRSIALALAVGAAAAPVAAAQQDLRSPDARDAALRPPEPTQDLRPPDVRDAAEGRGMDKAPIVEFVEVTKPSGFDWSDAGLGAAAGIGLVLVGAGGAIATVRLRRRPVGV